MGGAFYMIITLSNRNKGSKKCIFAMANLQNDKRVNIRMDDWLSIYCYHYYLYSCIPAFRNALINRFLSSGLLYHTFSVSPGAEYEQSQPGAHA